MEVTIFYAWQSDRPGKVNHHLIREAADAACARITEDDSNDWRVLLDSDTQGEAGMCDIPNTILQKIQKCDIFLADLTLIGTAAEDATKQFPNPNVVFELGYAARQLGFEAMVGVVNEAYGKVEGQVFDIKRRASLRYTAAEPDSTAVRKKATEQLSKLLEKVLRTTIETVIEPRRIEADVASNEKDGEAQKEFVGRVLSGNFHGFKILPAVLTSIQFRWPKKLEYEPAFKAVRAYFGVSPAVDADAIVWSGTHRVTELRRDGQLIHAYGGDYMSMKRQFALNRQAGGVVEQPKVLFAVTVQRNIVHSVQNHCRFLAQLQVNPPWQVGVSLVGAKGFSLISQSGEESPRSYGGDELLLPEVRVSAAKEVEDIPGTASVLRGSLYRLCRHFGWEHNFCYTNNGGWNVR